MAERRMTITDPQIMRAMAHPARLAILEYLGWSEAGATATECAEVVGLSPSATSYHLRELAKHGLIEQAPSRGDARERVWRRVGGQYNLDPGHSDVPEVQAAERALLDVFLARQDARVRAWVNRVGSEPEEWQRAVGIYESTLLMTAAELADLSAAIDRMLEPYRQRNRAAGAPEGARLVAAQYRAFPAD